MTQWNKATLPTETDADEWGNILTMDYKGMKAVYHWQDYIDDGMQDDGYAWMSLPPADEPAPITITVSSGERAITIHKFGDTIEIYDSEDPMGQPAVWEDDLGGIDGILTAVETVLVEQFEVEQDDEDATYQYNGGEQTESTCGHDCKCKAETPRQSFSSIYGAHWAW